MSYRDARLGTPIKSQTNAVKGLGIGLLILYLRHPSIPRRSILTPTNADRYELKRKDSPPIAPYCSLN